MSEAMRALHELVGYDELGVRVSMRGYNLVVGDLNHGFREVTPAEELKICEIFQRRLVEMLTAEREKIAKFGHVLDH